MADPPRYPDSDSGIYSTPRWVKVFGVVALVVVVLFIILMFTRGPGGRGHGPGRHLSIGEAGGQAPNSGVPEWQTPPGGDLGEHALRQDSKS